MAFVCLLPALLLAAAGTPNAMGADAAPALSPETKARIAELKKKGAACYPQWSTWTPQLKARFADLKPEAELEKMRLDFLQSAREILKLDPSDWDTRNNLGTAYLCENKPDPAIEQFQYVLKAEKTTGLHKANALLGMASAMFLKKDQAAMVKYLRETAQIRLEKEVWRGPRRYEETTPADHAKGVLFFLDGLNMDDLKLPRHSGAKVFPAAQNAEYTEEFVSLETVTLELGGGMKEDDARAALLRLKLNLFGIEVKAADASQGQPGFVVKINSEKTPAAPDRPQGYALAVTRDGAVINGRDKLGATWGVVSLIQLIDREKKAIRVCRIEDWPDVLNRCERGTAEHALFSKMDTILSGGFNEYRSPITRAAAIAATRQLGAFGIKHFIDVKNVIEPQIFPLTSERTRAFHREVFSELAENGCNVFWNYDDNRFPMHPQDVKISGTAAKQDAKYLGRLFAELKKSHPDFEMIYCPPYYWGPFYSQGLNSRPEQTRDEYLAEIGRHMNQPGLYIFWTGHRVVSYKLRSEDMDWITGLIRQKPAYWQNRPGLHNAYNYIAEEMTGFRDWYYDGFYGDISLYYLNTDVRAGASILSTGADCLWNVKGYDPKRSIRQAMAMLYGEKMFDILHPASLELAKLDKYRYGAITPEALAEIPELERIAKFAEERWNRAKAYNPEALEKMPGYFAAGVGFAMKIADAAKAKPDFTRIYAKKIAESRARAEKEIGLNESAGDIFISPAVCIGSTIMRGAQTEALSRVRFPFAGEAGTAYDIHVCGEQEPEFYGDPAPINIRISLNGTSVYEGSCNLEFRAVKTAKFAMPGNLVKAENTVKIEMLTDGINQHAGPFVALYAIVLKKAQ